MDAQEQIQEIQNSSTAPGRSRKLTIFEWIACIALFDGVLSYLATLAYSQFATLDRQKAGNLYGLAFLAELICFGLSWLTLFGIRKTRWKRLVSLAIAGILVTGVLGFMCFAVMMMSSLVC